jgi:hypothetical protein
VPALTYRFVFDIVKNLVPELYPDADYADFFSTSAKMVQNRICSKSGSAIDIDALIGDRGRRSAETWLLEEHEIASRSPCKFDERGKANPHSPFSLPEREADLTATTTSRC